MEQYQSFEDFLEVNKKMFPPTGNNSKPYFGPSAITDSKPKVRVAEKDKEPGLGDMATPSLKDPKANAPNGTKPDYSCLTTEDFLKETEGLDTHAFIGSLAENKDEEDDEIPALTCQYTGNKVHPSANEVSRYFAGALQKNRKARRTFVRELKGAEGGLGSLLSELFGHGETFAEIVNQMGNPDTKVAKKLVKAMDENHMSFMSEMGMLEHVDLPIDKRMGVGDVPPLSPMPNGMTDQPPSTPLPANDPADTGDVKPSMGVDAHMPTQAGGAAVSPTEAKINKEFSYHHLIKEMRNHDYMHQAMNEGLSQ